MIEATPPYDAIQTAAQPQDFIVAVGEASPHRTESGKPRRRPTQMEQFLKSAISRLTLAYRMKKTMTICFIAFLAFTGLTSKATESLQAEDLITSIRRQYSAINKRAGRYKKTRKALSGFSLEGGQLVAYFDGPALAKIVATHYGEMGGTVEEYYFANGKLIFVFEKVLHYNKPMSGKVVHTMENRYYFDNDNLIRWIEENGKQADTSSEEFRSKQKELLDHSKLFTAGARSKNPAIEQ
jgi:hypothetical protein